MGALKGRFTSRLCLARSECPRSRYVQYGCGWSAPLGWRNFDASPTLRFERVPLIGRLYTRNRCRFPANVEYGDIVTGLPVAEESLEGVYCSHVLEHLSLADFRTALRNTYTLLKPGGVFRMVVPDLEWLVERYSDDPSETAALALMRRCGLGLAKRDRNIGAFFVSWLGNSRHLWMWDFKSIRLELRHAGFDGIRRACFNDSRDGRFAEVEDRGRWENCLGVECTRPQPDA